MLTGSIQRPATAKRGDAAKAPRRDTMTLDAVPLIIIVFLALAYLAGQWIEMESGRE